MEINPIDKAQDLLAEFERFAPLLRRKSDNGYDWLEEDTDVCVEIPNPVRENSITIECQDDGEFTLLFAAYHSHFFSDEDGYARLCETVSDILNSKKCSAVLYGGEEKKWLGSTLISCEEVNNSVKDIFRSVLEHREFSDCLKAGGGEVCYVFWNSEQNRTVKIEKV